MNSTQKAFREARRFPSALQTFTKSSQGLRNPTVLSSSTTNTNTSHQGHRLLSGLPAWKTAQQQQQQLFLLQQVQCRWRHSGKMGHMKETLEELAHQPEREAAQERRKKKKERAAKKNKKGTASDEPEPEATGSAVSQHDDDAEEDMDFDEDLDVDDEVAEGGEDAEPTLPDNDQVRQKMMAYVERFQETLKSIRGAEPTAEMFDDIQVNAYGSSTPLKAVGQVVIVSPTLAQITCFDPSVAKDVQKAIQLALELNPQAEEGGTVKVPLPRVSMEVREQTAKQLKKKAESTKQRIRQVRRRAMELVKKGKDGKLTGVSKDEAFAAGKEIDSITESAMEKLQQKVNEKLNSIMAV